MQWLEWHFFMKPKGLKDSQWNIDIISHKFRRTLRNLILYHSRKPIWDPEHKIFLRCCQRTPQLLVPNSLLQSELKITQKLKGKKNSRNDTIVIFVNQLLPTGIDHVVGLMGYQPLHPGGHPHQVGQEGQSKFGTQWRRLARPRTQHTVLRRYIRRRLKPSKKGTIRKISTSLNRKTHWSCHGVTIVVYTIPSVLFIFNKYYFKQFNLEILSYE